MQADTLPNEEHTNSEMKKFEWDEERPVLKKRWNVISAILRVIRFYFY